ncbi:MAG: hypothetical protein E3J56_01135 [Candidatus Aminicenantes bacterium]|nr:MAG: hypothetical protein E3J56_01135 [Candidatus Aminicenantes bacterium]
MKNIEKAKQGRKARAAGARFELRVRKDLESKGWIVDKWSNNVAFGHTNNADGSFTLVAWKDLTLKDGKHYPNPVGELVKVKNKFLGPGKPMMLGAGFPDFIIMTDRCHLIDMHLLDNQIMPGTGLKKVYGLEVKSKGYLDKEEKAKCRWLLENNIFSNILVASKGTKRGQIVYKEFTQDK